MSEFPLPLIKMSGNQSDAESDFWEGEDDTVISVAKAAELPNTLELGKGRKGLQKALQLQDAGEWRNWLTSDQVKPFWLELWDSWLKDHGSTTRSSGLATVQEQLILGEKGGRRKYQTPFRNKAGWGAADHLACFLFWVRNENLESCEGVFYGKNLTEEAMDQAVWRLKTILIEMHGKAQINKPMGGTALFGTR